MNIKLFGFLALSCLQSLNGGKMFKPQSIITNEVCYQQKFKIAKLSNDTTFKTNNVILKENSSDKQNKVSQVFGAKTLPGIEQYDQTWTSQSQNSSESMPCGGGDMD